MATVVKDPDVVRRRQRVRDRVAARRRPFFFGEDQKKSLEQ